MERVDLALGSGGKRTREFIEKKLMHYLGNSYLAELHDGAFLNIEDKIVFTTDSFVINPIFFPGGDIGKLAVAGTVNDLVVSGAEPKFLSLAFVIEEGFLLSDLEKILDSIKQTASKSNTLIVTGDTKVVGNGQADKIYVNTAGIGKLIRKPALKEIKTGDKILVTGSIGDHTAAVMLAREEFEFEGNVKSDCAPLNFLMPLWQSGAIWMRDITRGGLATILGELSKEARISLLIDEAKIPLSPPVKAISELLGLDPLYMASEGKAIIVVKRKDSSEVLKILRNHPLGQNATIIGEVNQLDCEGKAILKTVPGGLRLLEPLTGELLPRIC
jgi:hydrogenase expression/formation protein HypE